jgi:hypothetical protein
MDPDPERRAESCGLIILLVFATLGIVGSFVTGTLSYRGATYRMDGLPFSYPKLFVSVVLLGFAFGYPPVRAKWWLCLPMIASGVVLLVGSRFWKAIF